VIAAVAPITEYVRLVLFGSSILYAGEVVVFAVALASSILVLWISGPIAITGMISVLRRISGRVAPLEAWRQATVGGLWPLPYCSGLGAALWIIYSLGDFGGWPSDFIFGAIGNLIGSWLAINLIVKWSAVWKNQNEN
jgi:hypothetical protein